MNKSELVENIAKKTGLSLKDANAAVAAFIAARTGHNPRTGESLDIPAVKVPAFRPGKTLKDAINK